MAKEKKKFKDTIFGKIIGKAGDLIDDVPKIIGQVASGNPLGAVATVITELSGKKDDPRAVEVINELTLRMKEIELEFAKVELEEFRIAEENITKRWESDMNSDSWLSKNIRPLGMAWVLLTTTILMIVSWCGVETPQQVLIMFGGLATSITGAYFVLRTVEKRNKNKYK